MSELTLTVDGAEIPTTTTERKVSLTVPQKGRAPRTIKRLRIVGHALTQDDVVVDPEVLAELGDDVDPNYVGTQTLPTIKIPLPDAYRDRLRDAAQDPTMVVAYRVANDVPKGTAVDPAAVAAWLHDEGTLLPETLTLTVDGTDRVVSLSERHRRSGKIVRGWEDRVGITRQSANGTEFTLSYDMGARVRSTYDVVIGTGAALREREPMLAVSFASTVAD